MPIYTYKCSNGHEQTEVHGMLQNPVVTCVTCGANPCHIAIQPVPMKVRHSLKGNMIDYREDLARFPNDPEALVDGPRALKRLIDKRKREGAQVRELSAVGTPEDVTEAEDQNMVMDAHQEAIDAINNGEES